MGTCVPVADAGSPYSRFRLALASENLTLVRATAAKLPAVPLPDALEVLCLLRRADPELYERAALRWLARLLLERPGITLRELEQGARALQRLPDVEAARGTERARRRLVVEAEWAGHSSRHNAMSSRRAGNHC